MMDLNPKDAELIIGLVARIGVNTNEVVKSIVGELEKYNYSVYEIKVTDQLSIFADHLKLVRSPRADRYFSYIKVCNQLRSEFQNNIMALLSIMRIVSKRKEVGAPSDAQSRTAFIVNQIKRPEEFELLRKVYGEHYIQISCHSDAEMRISRLRSLIVEDHPEDPKNSQWDIDARRLVYADKSQEGEPNGQRVRQVFPLSDVIINANSTASTDLAIERFIRALFGDPRVTPTRQEYGMELANTAAQRSSDMSRQVGAAILNNYTEIKALGCNEAPTARGGTYWEGDATDGRDFTFKRDSNEQRRKAVLIDLIVRLESCNALAPNLKTREQIQTFLASESAKNIAESQLMDSLEYGRSVHAEMNAITDAARGGHAIRGCVLYTNTFPCHNCAKHIVAAGISSVIFNHPYPKSYAEELFADSIVINPPLNLTEGGDVDKVIFRQFLGIVGPMYARVFTKARWKKEQGEVPDFVKSRGMFVRRTPIPFYTRTENLLLDELKDKLQAAGYLD